MTRTQARTIALTAAREAFAEFNNRCCEAVDESPVLYVWESGAWCINYPDYMTAADYAMSTEGYGPEQPDVYPTLEALADELVDDWEIYADIDEEVDNG